MTELPDAELHLRAQAAIAQAEDNLTSWHLAQLLAEDDDTVVRLGYKVYDQLYELDPPILARVAVDLLVDQEHHIRNAERIVAAINTSELAALTDHTCAVCGRHIPLEHDECEHCWLAAEVTYERGQDR